MMSRKPDYLLDNYQAVRPSNTALLKAIFEGFFKADGRGNNDGEIAILEPGCGPGRIREVIQEISNTHYVGIDIREDVVELAKKGAKGEIGSGDFLSHDFNNRKFDFVLFSHYLHLQHNATEHLQKAEQVLKEDGRILFLYEDCAYYSMLLGYPPAVASHHSIAKLHRKLQESFQSAFSSIGPYLPSEIDAEWRKIEDTPIHLFRWHEIVQAEKTVNWENECFKKSASVFSRLSRKQLKACEELGQALELNGKTFTFPVQSYLFYTGNPVRASRRRRTRTWPTGMEQQSNPRTKYSADEIYCYIQNGFTNLIRNSPAAFLSLWAISTESQKDDRDVFFAGVMPISELVNWYERYKTSIGNLPPTMSPSYLVAKANPSLWSPPLRLPALISEESIGTPLNKIYTLFSVSFSQDELRRYRSNLSKALNTLRQLCELADERLGKLFFCPLIVVRGAAFGEGHYVLLTSFKIEDPTKKAITELIDKCPHGDASVRGIFSNEQFTWLNLFQGSLMQAKPASLNRDDKHVSEVICRLEKIKGQLEHPWHDPETTVDAIRKGKCVPQSLIEEINWMRATFSDADVQSLDTQENKMVKLISLCKRMENRLYLWDWFGYVKALGHDVILPEHIDIRKREFLWEFAGDYGTADVFQAVQKGEERYKKWTHRVSSNDAGVTYVVTAQAEYNEDKLNLYHGDNWHEHQNTSVWIKLFQTLFGGALISLNKGPWKSAPQVTVMSPAHFRINADNTLFMVRGEITMAKANQNDQEGLK